MGFLTPSNAGEHANLKTFILQQFSQLRAAAYGLSMEQLLSRPTASSLSIGALLVHATEATRNWLLLALDEPSDRPEHNLEKCQEIPGEHTVEEFIAEYDRLVADFTEQLDRIQDLSAPVKTPEAPWYPPELKSWETRWVLTHLVAELARHAGHADIIRETIDGKTAFELNARNDGDIADDEEFQLFG